MKLIRNDPTTRVLLALIALLLLIQLFDSQVQSVDSNEVNAAELLQQTQQVASPKKTVPVKSISLLGNRKSELPNQIITYTNVDKYLTWHARKGGEVMLLQGEAIKVGTKDTNGKWVKTDKKVASAGPAMELTEEYRQRYGKLPFNSNRVILRWKPIIKREFDRKLQSYKFLNKSTRIKLTFEVTSSALNVIVTEALIDNKWVKINTAFVL